MAKRSSILIALSLMTSTFLMGVAVPAGATTASFSSTATVSPPTPNQYSGSAGGDGWGLAFTRGNVYNVFHHQDTLQVACHVQADGSNCPGYSTPLTITDSSPNGLYRNDNFATPAQSTVWINQTSGRLYAYATSHHNSGHGTAGVVCVDTTSNSSNPFCGFTPLSSYFDAPLQSGYSAISDAVILDSKFYAVNFYSTEAAVAANDTTTTNTMMCFSLVTFTPCASQPYAIAFGTSSLTLPSGPGPTIATAGTRIIVPYFTSSTALTDGNRITCFDTATNDVCSGTWPINDPAGLGVTTYGQGQMSAISCPPTDIALQTCTAVGYNQLTNLPTYSVQVDGVWQASVDFPANLFGVSNMVLNGISCVNSNNCVAAGADGLGYPTTLTELNGVWQAPVELANAPGMLNGVSCYDLADCYVVGSDYSTGLPMAASGGFGGWNPITDVGSIGASFTAISCADASDCTAVGSDYSNGLGLASTYSGGVWSDPVDITSSYGMLNSISCTDSSSCVAVGMDPNTYQGWYVTLSGGAWNPESDIAGNSANLYSVSCTDASQLDCVAVGSDSLNGAPVFVVMSGGSVGAPTDAGASGTLYGVVCGSLSTCAVVGNSVINYSPTPMVGAIDSSYTATLDTFPPNIGSEAIAQQGGALPVIDPTTGVQVGFCMRNYGFSCFDLSGAALSSPTALGLARLLSNTTNTIAGWESPATQFGSKIYFPVPSGADCYDFATAEECANYPISSSNLESSYSLTSDPNRPGCLWINADGGTGQIQNFDIYTGSTCGLEGDRFSVAQFSQPPTICNPQTYGTLVVQSPTPSQYSGGTVQFEDVSGNALGSALSIGTDGNVDLSSVSATLAAQSLLPQFLVALPGAPSIPVTVQMNWIATDDPSCYAAPFNSLAPLVSGGPVVGQSLSSTYGTWTSTTGTYSYQWYSCAGLACVSVGTNSATYVLQGSDVGNTVYSVVTATGLDGSTPTQQSSNAMGPVTALPTYLQLTQASTNFTANGNFMVGDAITLTATVSVGVLASSTMVPNSAGTVQFAYNATGGRTNIASCASVATLNGVATCTFTPSGSPSTYGTLQFSATFAPALQSGYLGSTNQRSSVAVVGQNQTPVVITNTILTSTPGIGIPLTASGGSGTIAYTWALSPGCAIEAGQLVKNLVGTCTVTAINPANGSFARATSSPVTFTFAFTPPVVPGPVIKRPPPLRIQFRFDSNVLTMANKKYLLAYAKLLIKRHITSITITGYASALGVKSYNLILSKWRAIAVGSYLQYMLYRLGHTNIRITLVNGGIRTTAKPWGLNQVAVA